MIIASLDLSKRSSGWSCWGVDRDTPIYGTWVLGSEFTSDGQTYAKLHQCLSDLRAVMKFDFLFYEQPLRPEVLQGHTNIDTLRVLAGLAAHAESYAYAVGCRGVQAVNMASWRKHFLGRMPRGTKTKQWKEYAIERCRQYGWNPRKDDEADALGLLDYACALKGIVPPWRGNETLRPMLAGARA